MAFASSSGLGVEEGFLAGRRGEKEVKVTGIQEPSEMLNQNYFLKNRDSAPFADNQHIFQKILQKNLQNKKKCVSLQPV